jgi:hypothetical protein
VLSKLFFVKVGFRTSLWKGKVSFLRTNGSSITLPRLIFLDLTWSKRAFEALETPRRQERIVAWTWWYLP